MANDLAHLSPYQRAVALSGPDSLSLAFDPALFGDDRDLLDVLRDQGTLPRQNIAGQYQIGGPIGPGDVLGAVQADPQTRQAALLAAEVAPGTGNIMAAGRLPTMYESFRDANTPIQKALRGAELGLEGLGAVGDAIPAIGAVGAAGAGLVGMMARQSDHLPALAQLARRQRGIIGSTGAKTADLDALEIAKRMQADGADADNIYATTGWWLDHPDGRPRFEIDDSESFLEHPRNAPPEYLRIQHDAMQDAYPDFDQIEQSLIKRPEFFRGGGQYDPAFDHITARGATDPQIHSTALHELNHAIESREGMARGGSPGDFPDLGDINTLAREWADVNELPGFVEQLNLPPGLNQEEIIYGGFDTQNTLGLTVARAREAAPDKAVFDRYRDLWAKHGYPTDEAGIGEAIQDINRRIEAPTPHDQYRRLAGESQARLVQDRMNLTPAERPARPFFKEYDVPFDDMIIRMDDGTALSRNGEPVGAVDDYRGYHEAPDIDEGSTLDNLTNIYPDDIYSARGIDYYGTREPWDSESMAVIRSMRGNPGGKVTVYRAVPSTVNPADELAEINADLKAYLRRGNVPQKYNYTGNTSEWYSEMATRRDELQELIDSGASAESVKINSGDWVTTSKRYARLHGNSSLGGRYKIIQKTVRADELATEGNSIHEWGYHAKQRPQPLPTDTASRMQRAREAGLTQDVYHGTRGDIDEFYPSDLGVHVGLSPDAANVRLTDTEATRQGVSRFRTRGQDYGENANVLPLKTAAKNSLRMEDVGEWRDPVEVLNGLSQSSISPDKRRKAQQLYNEAFELRDQLEDAILNGDPDAWYSSPEAEEFMDEARAMISGDGYDSVIYNNFIESSKGGEDSLIILDPANIRSKFAQFDPAKRDSANLLAGGVGGLALSDERRQKVDEHRQRIKAQLEASRK